MTAPTTAEADGPRISFELVTLFPEMFDGLLAMTVIGKAIAAATIAVHRTNPRDFGLGKHRVRWTRLTSTQTSQMRNPCASEVIGSRRGMNSWPRKPV